MITGHAKSSEDKPSAVKEWLEDWIPDEILSAYSSMVDSISVLNKTTHPIIKITSLTSIPILVGVSLSWCLSDFQTEVFTPQFIIWAMRFSISAAGFAVALMMFTGYKPDHTMSPDDARDFADKVLFMHFCQILTFVVATLSLLVSIAWMAANSINASLTVSFLNYIMMALLTLTISRVILLPFQIFELHAFGIESKVTASIQRVAEELDEQDRLLHEHHKRGRDKETAT